MLYIQICNIIRVVLLSCLLTIRQELLKIKLM